MKAGKIVLWTMIILTSAAALFAYTLFNGTPWGKISAGSNMEQYLERKYHQDFVVKKNKYNFLSETFQAYAYPRKHPELVFFVEEDIDSLSGYSDTYPAVFWESDFAGEMKVKVKEIYPELDPGTLKVQRIVEKGEVFGPHIPVYKEVPASQLTCSLTVTINKAWEQADPEIEIGKAKELSRYLLENNFPVLTEVWYAEPDRDYERMKAIFISEDGRIVEK